MLKSWLVAFTLSTVAGSSLLTSPPVLAMDDDAMMAKMDCTKAPEMLSNAQKMGTSTAYTGEIDRIVFPTVMDREKGTNMMLKIEAQCGTDPKMKAMAAKAAADSDARMKMMETMMPKPQ